MPPVRREPMHPYLRASPTAIPRSRRGRKKRSRRHLLEDGKKSNRRGETSEQTLSPYCPSWKSPHPRYPAGTRAHFRVEDLEEKTGVWRDFCFCQSRHASRRQIRQRLNSRPLRFSTTTLSPVRGWPSLQNSSSL